MSKTWNNCINKNIICEYAILFKKGGGKKKNSNNSNIKIVAIKDFSRPTHSNCKQTMIIMGRYKLLRL